MDALGGGGSIRKSGAGLGVESQSDISEMRSMCIFQHRVCFLFARVGKGYIFCSLDVLSCCGVLGVGVGLPKKINIL